MRIVLAAVGTRGDVQPLAALGMRLQSRGHEATICAPVNFADWLTGLGLKYVSIGEDFQANLKDYRDGGTAALLRLTRQFPVQFREMERACVNANVIVGAGFQFAGPSIAAMLGIPYYYVIYWPPLIPSSTHAPLGSPWQTSPGWLNRMAYAVWPAVWNLYFRRMLNRERKLRALSPVRNVHSYLAFSGHALLAFDPALGPVPPELATPHTVIGSLPFEQQRTLGPDLEEFLSAGTPPIYLGFGSMPAPDPHRLVRTFIRAALDVGHRAVIAGGWAGLRMKPMASGILLIGAAPHHLLFPRVRAVIHHGGAGTTASAARAGVPQIIVPHFGDQFYWGHRVHRSGLGPAPLSRSRLNAARLGAAIGTTFADTRTHARAQELGRRLRTVDTIAAAVAVIEANFGKPR